MWICRKSLYEKNIKREIFSCPVASPRLLALPFETIPGNANVHARICSMFPSTEVTENIFMHTTVASTAADSWFQSQNFARISEKQE